MKKPELLIPAGSLEVLKTAVNFGADAVYIGGEAFGLRAKAKNFSPEDMAEGIAYAHDRGVKVYVTANILAHNGDLEAASDYFMELKHLKTKDGRPVPPDALIISDPGLFMIAKRVCPEIELHISTQANSTNYETWLFWWNLGAKRVVSARELSLAELKKIRSHIPSDMEIESFVHGAMCISYSGRCLLSNYFTGRDANRGACTHPCRWKYAVAEETAYEEEDMGRTVYMEERPAPRESTHRLLSEEGKLLATLEQPIYTIGKKRGETDLVLNDQSISRLHARIIKETDGYYLEDMNSTNGTFKNGLQLQPYERRKLEEGDEITLGKITVIYR